MKKGGSTIYCLNCGNKQNGGLFCGNCGSRFGEIVEETRYSRSKPTIELNPVKSRLIAYRDYLIQFIKKPDAILEDDNNHFGHGLTTLLMFIILLGFANYRMNPITLTVGSAIANTFIFIGMGLTFVILVLFLLLKLFGPDLEFKSIIGLYGAYLASNVVLILISLLLLLVNFTIIAFILLSISILYALVFLPLYLLTRLLAQQSSNMEPHYSYMAYLVLFYCLYSLYLTIVVDAKLADLLLWLTQF